MANDLQWFWGRVPSAKNKEDVDKKKLDGIVVENKIENSISRADIVELIVKCSKEATKKQGESNFFDSLYELVTKLKEIFKSEYCAIGTVDEKYVIDRACTLKLSKDLSRASIKSQTILVCKALGYEYNKAERELIARYDKKALLASDNYEKYRALLNKDPENSTIIIIQDDEGDPQAYLQFINTESEIKETDFENYYADFLRLAFVVKHWFALEDERLFIKDFEFINGLSRAIKDVDNLLPHIMGYLSKEFNAGV